ncbi:MAG: xanthine dehydrogenase family protein subunit M [Desulfobacterota bacterium]|nr:xanthine dehydrogenase family protein subunit M [Thermodesulfobacteriota bacterium]
MIFYRRLPKFRYLKPRSEEELFNMISSEKKTYVFAGGTDLIPKLKRRLIPSPDAIVDLKGIPYFNYVEVSDGFLRIGPTCTMRSIYSSPDVIKHFPVLAQASKSVGAFQIQNRATLAGNICNAVPSADTAPALLVLEASLTLKGKKGERKVKIEEFFVGPNKTVIEEDEILREIEIPLISLESSGLYTKLSVRERMDLAIVGVATLVLKENGKICDVRIGLGAVSPTPIRAKKAEAILKDGRITEASIDEASKVASEEASPIDDHRASKEYRRLMVETLLKRSLKKLLEV